MGKQYEDSHTLGKAKTGAGKRALEARLPKIIETPKQLLALKGHSTSNIVSAILSDLHILKKPYCKKLQRKNEILPFEAGGEAHLENLSRLNDCSLFALVNHTKKRPHNLILGRTYAFRILDMMEFGITNYMPMGAFPSVKSAPGSKPLVLFNGDDFEASEKTRVMRSLLLDIFRGPDDVKAVNLAGIDRVIVLTLRGDSSVHFRHYSIELRKDPESDLPKVALKEAGPKFDMGLRRVRIAPDTLAKEAYKQPRDPRVERKKKNVNRDEMGDKKGRVHVGRQDLNSLVLARIKGLNKKRGQAQQTEGEDADGDVPTLVQEDPEVNGVEEVDEVENEEVEQPEEPVKPTPKRRKVAVS